MTYTRVVPRDLFNESQLLKCLGRLALLVEGGLGPPGLTFEAMGGRFEIEMRPFDGGIFVAQGLAFKVGKSLLSLHVPLYARDSRYPLLCDDLDLGLEVYVFFEDGRLSQDFLDYVALMQENKT